MTGFGIQLHFSYVKEYQNLESLTIETLSQLRWYRHPRGLTSI